LPLDQTEHPSARQLSKHVFILGAGFTRAFNPHAPLNEDNGIADRLVDRFKQFPHASRLLDEEQSRHPGSVNIEHLATRLSDGMPYDSQLEATEQFRLLFTELKRLFLESIGTMRNSNRRNTAELSNFAKYCLTNDVTCITLNYDDLLDEALYRAGKLETADRHWDPLDSYGFYCRHCLTLIQELLFPSNPNTPLLLKLHGSINWYPILGRPEPYSVDSIVHREDWFEDIEPQTYQSVSRHLEREPFVVLPILNKSAIMEQPILRLVWWRAYDSLRQATEVTFIGYSLPVTDIAMATLLHETIGYLHDMPISVINFAENKVAQSAIRDAYQKVLPQHLNISYYIEGALKWARFLT